MERIASFSINHDVLLPGIYTSRVDGDVVTYDIRMVRPNCGEYVSNEALHTIEHLFATYVRNGPHSAQVVYVGPMGCRTGLYLLVRDSLSPREAIALAAETMEFIAAYQGEIPGATPRECGNAAEHSLPQAKAAAAPMVPLLRGWTEDWLAYAQ